MQLMTTDQETLSNIARNVRRLRANRSQYWLAKACGTYPANVARLEQGEHMPMAGLLRRISEALEVPMQVLVEPPPKNPRRAG